MCLRNILFMTGIIATLTGCLELPIGTTSELPAGVTIENSGRLTLKHAYVDLKPGNAAAYKLASQSAESSTKTNASAGAEAPPPRPAGCDFDLAYVGQALPVSVAGVTVQANDVVIRGNQAYIAYNCAGDKFLGAVQILDISDPEKPEIIKEIKFTDLDVNCLHLDGNRLLFAGGANPDVRGYKAFIGAIELNNLSTSRILKSLKGLHSHTATSIAVSGGRIFVSVGAKDGGVEVMTSNFKSLKFVPIDDIRDIAPYKSAIVALAGTTDSKREKPELFFVDIGETRSVTLDVTMESYAKATIEVVKGKVGLLALSNSGLTALNLDNPAAPRYQLANPTTDELGPTNSASEDQGLMFVANGEYGFQCLKINDALGPGYGTLLGRHEMKGQAYGLQRYSANHIAAHDNHLFVASGEAGVNIYHLKRDGGDSSKP